MGKLHLCQFRGKQTRQCKTRIQIFSVCTYIFATRGAQKHLFQKVGGNTDLEHYTFSLMKKKKPSLSLSSAEITVSLGQ